MPAEQTPDAIVQDLLEHVQEALGLEGEVEVIEEGEELHGVLHGEELGLFIGRHGQTIDAVQHLAVRMVMHQAGERRRVVIDAEGYRARRREALERVAEEAADEAQRFSRAVALDAMTASERRLVHEYLRERGGVETHSEGEEPERHLVVSPSAG
jgi:spoIIIJ-associated protein